MIKISTRFAIGTAILVGLAVAVISSSHAIDQNPARSTWGKDAAGEKNNVPITAGPTPPPCHHDLITILDQNFDFVAPPILPSEWTAINAIDPDGILWQTSNSGMPSPPADTSPNAAWVNTPAVISDKYLDSPLIFKPKSIFVWMTFRHNFNLDASPDDPNIGFDGAVLEISIDRGQTFQDITTGGGRFVAGGYNRVIVTDRGSPIAGRAAWSGNSGGFITTVVELDLGELPGVVLRWRMASDNTGASEGWRVDTTDIVCCPFEGTPTPIPTATPTPTPRPHPTPRPLPTPLPRPTPL